MQKRLLSRREAVKYTGLSLFMLDRLIKTQKITTVRVGGRVLVHRDKLDAWIDGAAGTDGGVAADEDKR